MIHGHTRITLRNSISGNILKDIESENTFQSAVIAQALRNLGNANASMLTNSSVKADEPWKHVVGGILLFDNAITVGDNYLSPGTKMVGNGAYGIANAGTPVELGSYNSVESSATASAITQVYDFNTSQANGIISSVCLTSRMGGFIGYGNPSGDYATPLIALEDKQDIESLNPMEASESNKRAVVGNYTYLFSLSGTDLIVKKAHVPVYEGSVFDCLAKTITIDVSSLSHASVVDNDFHIAGMAGGKIYIVPISPAALTQGSTYKYWEYNPSNDTVSEKSFTNPSASTLLPENVSFANGNLFMKVSNTDKIAAFDMSTGIMQKEFVDADNVFWDLFEMRVSELPNGLTLVPINKDGDLHLAVYDATNDTVYITNGVKTRNNYYTNYGYDSATNSMQWVQKFGAFACNNPLYFATINNLNSPVTKTNAQTMKVTYTLSES